jgi:hypothetical protein
MRWVAIALSIAACTEPYVLVTVEGSDPVLTVSPLEISVGVYGNEQRVDFGYTARLKPPREGGVPATDFVVLVGDLEDRAQLRVSIPTVSTTWFADARFAGEGPLNLTLFAGERAVTTANFGAGDHDTSVLFGPGIVMGWVDSGGVQTRVERDPDRLISRANVVAPDAAAKSLRLASRPNPLGYGPDLYAVAWIGADGVPHLRSTTLTSQFPVRDLGGTADDIAVGVAAKGSAFAAAVATRKGDAVRLHAFDDAGLPATGALGTGVAVTNDASTLVGIVVTREGVIVATRGAGGSKLTLVAADGALRGEHLVPDGDLMGVALASDGSRLLSLERRGLELFQVTYFPTLSPAGIETSLGMTTLSGRASISACIAVWPELRTDGSTSTDLRFAILDADGRLVGEPHLLNVGETGDHLSPTSVCASQTRAYATFFERAGITDPVARLRIRRIPTY